MFIGDHHVILKPAFGSKTDSQNHRQSSWKLTSRQHENIALCPVDWIPIPLKSKHLIQLSKPQRNVAKSDSLFLALTGNPRPASGTIIAGWIKKLLREAGIEATAGSVRSAVASKNWIDNFQLDDILARGNWKSANTFRKFYQREIINSSTSSTTITSCSLLLMTDLT